MLGIACIFSLFLPYLHPQHAVIMAHSFVGRSFLSAASNLVLVLYSLTPPSPKCANSVYIFARRLQDNFSVVDSENSSTSWFHSKQMSGRNLSGIHIWKGSDIWGTTCYAVPVFSWRDISPWLLKFLSVSGQHSFFWMYIRSWLWRFHP